MFVKHFLKTHLETCKRIPGSEECGAHVTNVKEYHLQYLCTSTLQSTSRQISVPKMKLQQN